MQHPNGLVLDRPESAPAGTCPSWCIVNHADADHAPAGSHSGRYVEVILAEGNRFVAQLWGGDDDLKLSLQFAKASLFGDETVDQPFDPTRTTRSTSRWPRPAPTCR
jgi:hypothetical protein